MLDFPRWKVLSIFGLIAALMLLALPSFLPERITNSWGRFPYSRISLGLDLAGGSYLLIEADKGGLQAARVDLMRDRIGDAMRAAPSIGIGDIARDGNRLSFMLRDVSKLDDARERLNKLTQGAGMTGQRDWDLSVVDGSRIVMTPTQAGFDQALKEAMSTATDVVRTRIDKLGTREPTIIGQGSDRIVVQVPGLNDPKALKELLGTTAKLEFKMVDETPYDPVTKNVPIGSQALDYPEGGPGAKILVKRRAILTGDQLVSASQGFGQQNTTQPIVNFAFDSAGGKVFARITQDNVGKRFAVVIDNKVISAPRINTPILGGAGYIEGNFTVESANNLAIALSSGKLPLTLKVIEERTVGPDLGADSIRSGILASIVAVTAVVIFMFLTYGRFGLYANLAVVINVIVIVGVMAVFKGTLTLPGIAGFVLTIGTAVDANVLINERIREERRRGRNVVQAVEIGYKEARHTIFEANYTHAISGIIMFTLGSGPVRGFAVVLLIGICTSVFTAVVFTRMLIALWLRKNRPTDINI